MKTQRCKIKSLARVQLVMGREEGDGARASSAHHHSDAAPQRSPAELRKGGHHCPVELTASGCS